jgi:hypothetical protein
MEYINKNGIINQPDIYGVNPQFIVEDIYEDQEYMHIKGEVGYIDKKIENTDAIEFHLQFNKEMKVFEIKQSFRTIKCDKEEYEKFADKWFYNKQMKNVNDILHFPYFILKRSKDCVLIPHFIKSLWKYEDTPKISIFVKDRC